MKMIHITSFLYAIAQITGGLLLHPYQTMQSLTREKVFAWMTFLPIGVFCVSEDCLVLCLGAVSAICFFL